MEDLEDIGHIQVRLQDVIDSTADIVVIQSPNFTVANKTCERILGYSSSFLSKKSSWEKNMHPADLIDQEIFPPQTKMKLNRYPKFRFKHRKGHWVWLEFRMLTSQQSQRIWLVREVTAPRYDEKGPGSNIEQTGQTNFLTDTATKLIQVQTIDGLFDFVGDQLRKLLDKKGLIIITLNNEDQTTWHLQKLMGTPSLINKLLKLIKVDISNLTGPVHQGILSKLKNQKLISTPLDLADFAGKKVAKLIPGRVLDQFGLKHLVALSLTQSGKALGNISFILNDPDDLRDHRLIVSFCDQISMALERLMAKQALMESENNYRILAESSQDYIMRFDRDARLIYINESIAKNWNLNPTSILGKNHVEILGDTDEARAYMKTIKKVFKQKKSLHEVVETLDKNGNKEYLDWRLYPVFGSQGKVESVLSMSRDITHRIRNEDVLNKMNQQLNNIIHSVPGAVYLHKVCPENSSLYMSSQIHQICGYDNTKFQNNELDFNNLILEIDRSKVMNTLEKARRTNSGFEMKYRIKTRDHSEKWIWENGIFSTYEDCQHREGFIMDITDRVKQEDRILAATVQAEDFERNRISSEINDGMQQTLVSSLMNLQSLKHKLMDSIENESLMSQFSNSIRLLQEGVNESRGISQSIMPKSIKDFGLINTIESLIASMNEKSEVTFDFHHNIQNRMDIKVETSFYRIIQEAFSNIQTNSKASKAIIQLMKYPNTIVLTIEDDGIGFDVNEENLLYTGLGISYMRSRANSVGANFEINSKPGYGTSIQVELPLVSH